LKVEFELNGERVSVEAEAWTTLADLLREGLGVLSVKKGCEQGECGACTVLLNGEAVPSCMVLAPQVEGAKVTTLEGLEHHPIMLDLRDAFIEGGAVQCGFCTPGMLISSYALLRDNPHPTPEEVKEALVGNICRCTGYTKIIDAVLEAAERVATE